ncbi:inorganic phosphate transporter [Pullulanibacillus sp. KACC 23026]|uniref:inorganic phosphate transporter n=1 Tax=Pullulanibacillus sp. KACC 23026 TaxID=3028315 RepID=UPI0023B03B9A|nr:inorganic phosphate transporter [Pullulanibacillus sp. KACC 23026]WEG12084.1 inorganic phosphate transporter [Pullulanibacillus sp. KACC 23026]
MTLTTIAIIISLFFAINIGASGTAASMGAAYGAGAIKKRWIALLLASLSVLLGAYFGGGEVVKTIGKGLIPSTVLTSQITIIILVSACLTLFLANLLGIPLSTSEVTVGAVVGVGIASKAIYGSYILFIVVVWIALPFLAFCCAYLLGKLAPYIEKWLITFKNAKKASQFLIVLLILSGCYEAFSAGMNNVANAVGPLVGAGLIDKSTAILWGGLFVALGAFALGGKVLDTNAKKITKLSLLQGSMVSLTSGTLVVIASIFGLPVPLTQATTMAIFGIGTTRDGLNIWKSDIVKRIIKVWITSPISSMIISYLFVEALIEQNIYEVIIVFGAFVMTIGLMSFLSPKKSLIK